MFQNSQDYTEKPYLEKYSDWKKTLFSLIWQNRSFKNIELRNKDEFFSDTNISAVKTDVFMNSKICRNLSLRF